MRQDLYSAAGIYSTSYLKMKVDTEDSFLKYDETLSEFGAATFLHEYIHFLQDITTTEGLFNIATEVDFIKLFNSKLQPSGVMKLKVPFTSSPQDGPIHANLSMKKITVGGGEHKNYNGDYIVDSEQFEVSSGISLERVYIQWGSPDKGGAKYYFGSYCICESMAYEIEQVIYKDVIKPDAPQMPYQSARLISDKILPGFTQNIENLIALCDASMMYNNSASVFFQILKKMRDTQYKLERPEDIYEYVYKKTEFSFEFLSNPIELFNYASHLANLQVNEYFRSNIFKANSIWIARTLSAAQHLRVNIPNFVLDLTRGGDIRKDNKMFNFIKRKIGTPVIVNKKHEVYFENILHGMGYDIEPQYFWVFKEIKELITEDWSKRGTPNLCGLKDFCDASCKERGETSFTDIRCRNEPWNRSNDANKDLCVFGATWKTWALQGKELEQ